MIYAGIGMVAVSLFLLLILTIVFRTGRKKLKIRKIKTHKRTTKRG